MQSFKWRRAVDRPYFDPIFMLTFCSNDRPRMPTTVGFSSSSPSLNLLSGDPPLPSFLFLISYVPMFHLELFHVVCCCSLLSLKTCGYALRHFPRRRKVAIETPSSLSPHPKNRFLFFLLSRVLVSMASSSSAAVAHLLVLPLYPLSFSLSRVLSGCKNIATIRASNIAPRAVLLAKTRKGAESTSKRGRRRP